MQNDANATGTVAWLPGYQFVLGRTKEKCHIESEAGG